MDRYTCPPTHSGRFQSAVLIFIKALKSYDIDIHRNRFKVSRPLKAIFAELLGFFFLGF